MKLKNKIKCEFCKKEFKGKFYTVAIIENKRYHPNCMLKLEKQFVKCL